MEEPFLTDASNEAQSRLEDIKREIRFFDSDLRQLEELQEETPSLNQNSYNNSRNPEINIGEKLRESGNAIKSIQILINDFKNDYRDWPNWDEFKRSQKHFNELVEVFNGITEAEQGPLRRNHGESEDDLDESMVSQQRMHMMENSEISIHNVLDQEDMIKERGERIQNINQSAVTVNALATEVNQGIFDTSNMIDNIVKNTFDANQNLLKANKELDGANHRAATRRNFCLRLVVTLAMLMLAIGFIYTRGYYLGRIFGMGP